MRYLLFFLAAIFVCCKNEKPENQLVVVFPQISLRDAPGKKSNAIRVLKHMEEVTDLNEVSNFESSVYFNDKNYQSPWIKVKTADHQVGWVFGSALQPMQRDTGWFFQKRMRCYFGTAITDRRNRLLDNERGGYRTRGDKGLAADYRESVVLRDTIIQLLTSRAEPSEASFQPDFSWLQDVLPGFIVQYVAEGTQPFLFADFRVWREKSLDSPGGQQDDAFFNTCFTAFPTDSIESFFPAWKFQISDYEAVSQLGTGVHLKMLRQIDAALTAGDIFRPELMALKESVLEDIVGKNTAYWQPKELILKELNQIIHAKLSCLDTRDRTALQSRLTMFENPEANGLHVNLRSG